MARLLLDECIDRRLKRSITGHTVSTVHELQALGCSDAEVLSLAEGAFDVLVTVDKNLVHQHDISRRAIAVIVLAPRRATLAHLLLLIPALVEAAGVVSQAKPGCFDSLVEPESRLDKRHSASLG